MNDKNIPKVEQSDVENGPAATRTDAVTSFFISHSLTGFTTPSYTLLATSLAPVGLLQSSATT